MLAQAQLLSCLASEKNRHSGGCALPCIPCVPRRGQPGPEYTCSKHYKGKHFLVTSNRYACTHLLFLGPRRAASSGVTDFMRSDTSPFKQFSNSLRAISRLEKFRLRLLNTELQQISPETCRSSICPETWTMESMMQRPAGLHRRSAQTKQSCHSLLAHRWLLQIQQLHVTFSPNKESWQHCTMATLHSPWNPSDTLSRQEQNSSGKTTSCHSPPLTSMDKTWFHLQKTI